MKRIVSAVCAVSMVAGCATSSKDVASVYVSPLQYHNHDCQQLQMEAQRVQGRAMQLAGRLDQAASNDKMIMTGGALLFWPALFALGGTKQQEADYARMQGEYEAIQQASIAKKCTPGSAVVASASPASAASAP